MKYLLTAAGIRNTSIHNALLGLLGKPIAEAHALCIPTASYPFPGGPKAAYRFISGATANPMCELGWKSLGVLELTALPSIKKEYWIPEVQAADALLVQGAMLVSVPLDARPAWPSCPRCAIPSTWGSARAAGDGADLRGDLRHPSAPFVIGAGLGLAGLCAAALDHAHPESPARVEPWC